MTISSLGATPSGAAQAYAKVASDTPPSDPAGFGAVLGRAVQGLVDAGHTADAQSVRAIGGDGNVTEVAIAVSRAELALQSAVAVRDKVVQAYQDVMRMPI